MVNKKILVLWGLLIFLSACGGGESSSIDSGEISLIKCTDYKPLVRITYPINGAIAMTDNITVIGTINNTECAKNIIVNGVVAEKGISDLSWKSKISLDEGGNSISVSVELLDGEIVDNIDVGNIKYHGRPFNSIATIISDKDNKRSLIFDHGNIYILDNNSDDPFLLKQGLNKRSNFILSDNSNLGYFINGDNQISEINLGTGNIKILSEQISDKIDGASIVKIENKIYIFFYNNSQSTVRPYKAIAFDLLSLNIESIAEFKLGTIRSLFSNFGRDLIYLVDDFGAIYSFNTFNGETQLIAELPHPNNRPAHTVINALYSEPSSAIYVVASLKDNSLDNYSGYVFYKVDLFTEEVLGPFNDTLVLEEALNLKVKESLLSSIGEGGRIKSSEFLHSIRYIGEQTLRVEDKFYFHNENAIFEINIKNGNRKIIRSPYPKVENVLAERDFNSEMIFNSKTNELIFFGQTQYPDLKSVVIGVNVETLISRVISGLSIGSGPEFYTSCGLALNEENQTIYITYGECDFPKGLMAINIQTGNREFLNGTMENSKTVRWLNAKRNTGFDVINNRVLYGGSSLSGLNAYDLETKETYSLWSGRFSNFVVYDQCGYVFRLDGSTYYLNSLIDESILKFPHQGIKSDFNAECPEAAIQINTSNSLAAVIAYHIETQESIILSR